MSSPPPWLPRIQQIRTHLATLTALLVPGALPHPSQALLGLLQGYSPHVVCVTILTVRSGNTATSAQYAAYHSEWARKLSMDEPVPELGVGRSATFDAEEGTSSSLIRQRVAHPLERKAGEGSTEALIRRWVAIELDDGNRVLIEDSIFLEYLDETQKYEKGLTYRLLVWIPMLLALLKLLTVTGGWGVWGPKVCGFMFFGCWLTTELVTIVASRSKLDGQGQEEVLVLGRRWRKEWEEKKKILEGAFADPRNFIFDIFAGEIREPFRPGRMACTILLAFNAWPLMAISAGPFFTPYFNYYSWVDSFLWSPGSDGFFQSVVEIGVLYPFVLFPFIFYVAVYGWVIFLLTTPYIPISLAFAASVIIGGIIRGFGGEMLLERASKQFHLMDWKMEDLDGLVPGYLALAQALLTLLRYRGVLIDFASYDCTTTHQVAWYDWTG